MPQPVACSVLFSLLASAACADSLPPGLTFTGESRVEYLSGNGTSTTSILSTLNVGYHFAGSGGLTFGVDLGAESWSLRNASGTGGDLSWYYFEGVVEGGFGSLAIGQTRGAAQSLIALPPIAGSGSLENTFITSTGPGLRHELTRGGYNPGLRYQFALSGTKVAASINHVEGYGNVAQLVASAPLGPITVEGALEFDLPSNSTSVLLGAKGSFGAVDAGIYHFTDGFYNTGGSTRLFATYHLTDQIQTNLTLMKIGDVTLSGLDATYSTAGGMFGQAGVITSSDVPDPILSLTAGMSF